MDAGQEGRANTYDLAAIYGTVPLYWGHDPTRQLDWNDPGLITMDWGSMYPSLMTQQQNDAKVEECRALIDAEALDILAKEWIEWRDPKDGACVFHLIINYGSVDLVRRALSSPLRTQLGAETRKGYTPLYYAVLTKSMEKTRLLLDAGAQMPCSQYIDAYCPFQLTVNHEDIELAILLLTAQGHPFPDGHDQGCCYYSRQKYRSLMQYAYFRSVEEDRSQQSRQHIMRCGGELSKRRSRRADAFYPFLFHLKRAMSGGIRIVYTQIVLPMLEFLWRYHGYDPCWKEK